MKNFEHNSNPNQNLINHKNYVNKDNNDEDFHDFQPYLHAMSLQPQTLENTVFNQETTKCPSGNQGALVCINKDCLSTQPFICLTKKCKCFEIHLNCDQKRIDSIQISLKDKQKKNHQKKQLITTQIESLNDLLSDFSDQLDQKLKPSESETPKFSNPYLTELAQLKDSLQKRSLTGHLVHKIFNSDKLKVQKTQHDNLIKQITEKFSNFQNKQLKKFLDSIQNMLISPVNTTQQLSFSAQLLHKNLAAISDCYIITKWESQNYQMVLMNPPLFSIHKNRSIQRWKLRFSVKNGFQVGVVSAKQAEAEGFESLDFKRTSETGIVFNWDDFTNLDQVWSKVKLKKDDQFEVSYDAGTLKIMVVHLRSGAYKEIDLIGLSTEQEHTIHFMVGLKCQDDMVEIVSYSDGEEGNEKKEILFKLNDSKKENSWIKPAIPLKMKKQPSHSDLCSSSDSISEESSGSESGSSGKSRKMGKVKRRPMVVQMEKKERIRLQDSDDFGRSEE